MARRCCLYFALLLFLYPFDAGLSAPERVVPQSKQQLQFSFAPVVKQAAPAVVNIFTSRVLPKRNVSPMMDDPIFKHFFGEDFFKGQPKTRTQGSLGSGVIVRSDGVVITNNHVIKNAESINVVLADGREFNAKVIVREPRTDLAALQLQGDFKNLPFLKLGDADELEVGDVVLAIGNPFGLGQTVTSGVVSALARTRIGVSDLRSFIQTDAAINSGNSGGALVSLDGKLVGINTMIFSRSGGSIGLGFAIPVNLITPVILSVDKKGKIERPWLGADVRSINKKMANAYGLDRPTGVLVTGVYPNSPAQKAGVKTGDLILTVDGYSIKDEAGLDFRIASKLVGYQSQLVIREKNGREKTLMVSLEIPPGPGLERPIFLSGNNPLSGTRMITLSPAIAAQLGVDFMQKGVVILKVESGSMANRVGLLPGDIIETVNGAEIESVQMLVQQLKRAPKKLHMVLRRGKKKLVLSLKS